VWQSSQDDEAPGPDSPLPVSLTTRRRLTGLTARGKIMPNFAPSGLLAVATNTVKKVLCFKGD
jgi:hypothetical protein